MGRGIRSLRAPIWRSHRPNKESSYFGQRKFLLRQRKFPPRQRKFLVRQRKFPSGKESSRRQKKVPTSAKKVPTSAKKVPTSAKESYFSRIILPMCHGTQKTWIFAKNWPNGGRPGEKKNLFFFVFSILKHIFGSISYFIFRFFSSLDLKNRKNHDFSTFLCHETQKAGSMEIHRKPWIFLDFDQDTADRATPRVGST